MDVAWPDDRLVPEVPVVDVTGALRSLLTRAVEGDTPEQKAQASFYAMQMVSAAQAVVDEHARWMKATRVLHKAMMDLKRAKAKVRRAASSLVAARQLKREAERMVARRRRELVSPAAGRAVVFRP